MAKHTANLARSLSLTKPIWEFQKTNLQRFAFLSQPCLRCCHHHHPRTKPSLARSPHTSPASLEQPLHNKFSLIFSIRLVRLLKKKEINKKNSTIQLFFFMDYLVLNLVFFFAAVFFSCWFWVLGIKISWRVF